MDRRTGKQAQEPKTCHDVGHGRPARERGRGGGAGEVGRVLHQPTLCRRGELGLRRSTKAPHQPSRDLRRELDRETTAIFCFLVKFKCSIRSRGGKHVGTNKFCATPAQPLRSYRAE